MTVEALRRATVPAALRAAVLAEAAALLRVLRRAPTQVDAMLQAGHWISRLRSETGEEQDS